LGKALSAAVAAVPAGWAGAWLSLILLWAAVTGWPLIFLHAPFGKLPVLGWGLILALLGVIAQGGLYRTFIFGRQAPAEGRGPGGVQIGAAEVRLLLAAIVIALFLAVIAATLGLVFAVAFNMSGLGSGYGNSLAGWHAALVRHHGAGDWTFILLPVVMALFLAFTAVKFVLAPAATVAERRVVTLNALGLSSGNTGKLFVGIVLLALPVVLFAGVLHHMPLHDETRMGTFQGAGLHMHLLAHAVMAALSIGLLLPAKTGFLASAYRQIVDLRTK